MKRVLLVHLAAAVEVNPCRSEEMEFLDKDFREERHRLILICFIQTRLQEVAAAELEEQDPLQMDLRKQEMGVVAFSVPLLERLPTMEVEAVADHGTSSAPEDFYG